MASQGETFWDALQHITNDEVERATASITDRKQSQAALPPTEFGDGAYREHLRELLVANEPLRGFLHKKAAQLLAGYGEEATRDYVSGAADLIELLGEIAFNRVQQDYRLT